MQVPARLSMPGVAPQEAHGLYCCRHGPTGACFAFGIFLMAKLYRRCLGCKEFWWHARLHAQAALPSLLVQAQRPPRLAAFTLMKHPTVCRWW